MSRPTRLLFASALTLIGGGCHSLSQPKAKQLAEKRWTEVRAGVKLQLARQQYEGGLFDDVVRTATDSIALDSTRAEAYVLLAQANLELSKPASAEQAIEAARRSGLESADLRYMRGVVHELRNNLEAALGEYSQARMMNPENVDYLVAQAECLVALDRAEEALTLLDENIHRFDANGTIAVLAGRIAALLGDWDGAAKRLEQAAVTLSSNPIVAEELGLLFVNAGRFEEALALLRPLIESSGESERASARRGVATCFLNLGDPSLAKAVLIDYVRISPEDGAAQLLLARASLETGDLMTAARAVDLAEHLGPGRGDVAIVRAALQWRRSEYANAADTLYGLLERDPSNVEAYCLLAEVLQAQEQLESAKDCLERALNINPSCILARRALQSIKGRIEQIPTAVGASR